MISFNGVNERDGLYFQPELSEEEFFRLIWAAGGASTWLDKLKRLWETLSAKHAGVMSGVNPESLPEAGWGVVWHESVGDDVKAALKPLLDLRKAEVLSAENRSSSRFRELVYKSDDTYESFLVRYHASYGAVDPDLIPYYLLLVGDCDSIPYAFQYQLDVQYAVGRIHFHTASEYSRYAQAVVRATETGNSTEPAVDIFAPSHDGDTATNLSSSLLCRPLENRIREKRPLWLVASHIGSAATKEKLHDVIHRSRSAVVFSACHGLACGIEDPELCRKQGALICQDWPGPAWTKPIPESFYYSGDKLEADADLTGRIFVMFACFSAGSPVFDGDVYRSIFPRRRFSKSPIVAHLPSQLLARPKGGALAAVGHVGPAWGYTFLSPTDNAPSATDLESLVFDLMDGKRVGQATSYLNVRHAELSTHFVKRMEDVNNAWLNNWGKYRHRLLPLAQLWIALNDSRTYVVVGDPAVHITPPGQST